LLAAEILQVDGGLGGQWLGEGELHTAFDHSQAAQAGGWNCGLAQA